MTPYRFLARTVASAAVLLAVSTAAAEQIPHPARKGHAPRILETRIEPGSSRLKVGSPEWVVDKSQTAGEEARGILVALPRGTTGFGLHLDGPEGSRISAPDGLMILRGQPVVRVVVTGARDQEVDVTVTHDGSWDRTDHRLGSDLAAAVLGPTLPKTDTGDGSYLIIYPPALADAVAPLADWKARKGFRVRTVSTEVTGASTTGIRDYIQNAYDTWEIPPEYILLAGDIESIPTFNFHANPTDHPYVMLDGDDWLMDAAIGRLPVENPNEAAALINKTINYERYPDLAGDPGWQTRSLMVAGVYASDTPGYTVDFCGEMLQDMGFPQPLKVESPPLPSLQGAAVVRNTINSGVGFVIYRGWAYGTAGWDPPTFTVDDIPSLDTNEMTPIVMSFVCLNGDYTASSPCFGEVFVRQGSPTEPGKGAVAFIGNGEHWSHTRYNDAMAISVFERIGEDGVTDLGTLLNAGKMRFMDYFPNEISADEFGEESVEFYFHIYNLMGDPSLKFWRETPRSVVVDEPSVLMKGATHLALAVTTSDGGAPVAGARVGVMQNGIQIGRGMTGADGTVDVELQPVVTGSYVDVTVSEAGIIPFESAIPTGTAGVYLAATALEVNDSAGNGDQTANPGEFLSLTPTMHNHGSSTSSEFTLSITGVAGPASVQGGPVTVPAIPAGSEAASPLPLGLRIDADAPDGSAVTLVLDTESIGGVHNTSTVNLDVQAPAWTEVFLAAADGSAPQAGQTTDLVLNLSNTGSIPAVGGTANLTLTTPGGAVLGTTSASIPDCQPGESVATGAVFDVNLPEDMATGTNLTFDLEILTTEGYLTDTTCAVVVGPVDVTTPVGPDRYGYFAYDSADYDYPDSRPVYFWNEISTALGGPGTKLDFPIENEVVWMVIDLPFTFRYYGQDYTQIRVSDNGWVSFDTGTDYDFYNWTIPTQYGVEALVAPFWDNLNPAVPGPQEENVNGIDPDGIYTHHDTGLGGFVVEWSRLPHYKPEILGLQTFQLILLDPASHPTTTGDGEMLFLYRQVNNNDNLRMYATVGIESPDGTDGLQLSYGNINTAGMAPLQPGLAVRVTTEPPVRVPFTLAKLTAVPGPGRTELHWEPADDRPVIGWHVDRVRSDVRERLTTHPIPAGARTFTATGQADDDQYIVTALHPYGASSEAGRTKTNTVIRLALHPIQPNPGTGSVKVGFALPQRSQVRLQVYDVAGRLVRTLVDGIADPGEGVKIWDGRDDGGVPAAGGVYFFRLEAETGALTRKMILLR